MTKRIAVTIAFLTGLGMIFIGARFLITPETAELGYGIHFNEQGDYSFHYMKGIRDLFAGLLICVLVVSKQTKALGITLFIGTIIPVADMLIVLSKNYNGIPQAVPHIVAVIICFFCGLLLLTNRKKQQTNNVGFAKIIQSAATHKESILEFCITPNEKTPWHYHTLFSETFEVLKGTLQVGKNKEVFQLRKGDIVTIKSNEKHYYHNISKNECLIKVTITPSNRNFENAILILKGLAKDGLANAAGTPKKLSDLALFVYLNNSKMVGLQKIAGPVFNYLAARSVKKGRLKELERKYCEK